MCPPPYTRGRGRSVRAIRFHGSLELPYVTVREGVASRPGESAWLVPSNRLVLRWHMDAKGRRTIGQKSKSSESEKITINLGLIDLGQIDLLVQEGFYSNRTDFIRTSIRNHLTAHVEAVRQTIVRKTLVVGLQEFSRRDLESARKARSKLRIHVLGLVRIATDVSPALARETIESVEVLGALHASPAVKAALADRII